MTAMEQMCSKDHRSCLILGAENRKGDYGVGRTGPNGWAAFGRGECQSTLPTRQSGLNSQEGFPVTHAA